MWRVVCLRCWRPVHAPEFQELCALLLQCSAAAQAEPSNTASALSNAALRLLSSLAFALSGGPRLCVVVTTRPDPPHILAALSGHWGRRLRTFQPRELRVDASAAPGAAAAAARHPSLALLENEDPARRSFLSVEEALEANAESKVFCAVLRALITTNGRLGSAAGVVPRTLSDAYAAFFAASEAAMTRERRPQEMEVKALLEVLVAAREPPSLVLLAALGARRPFLPARGSLR